MAIYQELVLACNLKKDVPQQVIDILNYMIALYLDFKTGQSYHIPAPDLPGDPFTKLRFDDAQFAQYYKFTTRAMMKSGDWEFALFLLWLVPYSETEGFVGYTRDDENEQAIDLIYFEN